MRARGVRAVLAFVLVVGCGRDERGPGEAAVVPRRSIAEPLAPRPEPLVRVARGAREFATYAPGAPLPEAALLPSPSEVVDLDLRGGARLSLEPGARVAVDSLEGVEVHVGEGLVHVVLSPEGNSARPALRIATPRVVVVARAGIDAWLAVRSDGVTWLAVLGGSGEMLSGEVDPESGRVHRDVIWAGRTRVLGTTAAEAGDAPAAAAATGHAFLETAPGAPLGVARDELLAATHDLEEAQRTHAGHAARHGTAVRTGGSETASLAREQVRATQRVMRARERVIVLLERHRATALRSGSLPTIEGLEVRLDAAPDP